jgi:two-component system response regulator AlgR
MQTDHSILIVDSHADARSQLRQTLKGLHGVFPHRVVGEADSAQSAIDQVTVLRPSLMLVDTGLADMNGIELGRRLAELPDLVPEAAAGYGSARRRTPQLIYVSRSDRYALDAFEVRALDYLLKPVDGIRLLRALSRANRASDLGTEPGKTLDSSLAEPVGTVSDRSLTGAPAAVSGSQAISPHPGSTQDAKPTESGQPAAASPPLLIGPPPVRALPPPARRHFAVHERGRLMLVPVEQVVYLKAELKYVTVRTRSREYLVEDSLTALEAEFGDRFVRVHRNALVCRACIAGFERVPPEDRTPGAEPHWQVVLRDVPERLAISRRQWSTVRTLMG